MITCDEFSEVQCCDSCHQDIVYGFGLLDFYDKQSQVPRALVCCAILRWCNEHKIDLTTITKDQLELRLEGRDSNE